MNGIESQSPMPTRLNWTSIGRPAALGILLWILALALIVAAPSFAGEDPPVAAPRFSLPSLKGQELTLSDYQGKYLLINFWATWCGPCKLEMSSLELLYRKFKERNLAVVAISNDIFGAQVVAPFIQTHHLTFRVGLDPQLKVSDAFGVIHLPTTFLIDPRGKIIGVLSGAENWADPKTLLYFDQLLATPVEAAETQQSSPCKNNQTTPC